MFSIKKYSKLKSLFGLTTSLFLSFSLISCDLFNLDLEGFFVKYTETAAIDKDFKTDSIGIDISGIECVESNEDKTVTFYLRNPQHYKLLFSYEFDHKEIAGKFSSQDVCSFSQSDDGNSMTMTFNKEFLYELEMGAVEELDEEENPTGRIQKDISGTILITESETERVFEPYHLQIAVNSLPPRMRGAVIQRDQGVPNNSGKTAHLVACFNIKNLSGTVHQADTKDLYIGNELYHIDFSSGSISITDSNGSTTGLKLSVTPPPALCHLDGSESVFTASSSADGYLPLYYTTDIDADSEIASNTLSYTIKLKDDANFSTSATVENVIDRLRPPSVNVTSTATDYSADDVTGTFDLVISHGGESFHKEGDVEIESTPASKTPSITYEVYNQSGTVVAEGTKASPVTIPVEIGKYYVKAYASCAGYIDSDYMDDDETHCASLSNAFTVHRSQNFYVNKQGSNGACNGSKNKPYRTIQKCIDQIREIAENDPTDNSYSIILQSDITSDSSDTTSILADFTKNGVSSTEDLVYYIEGNGYTINAAEKTVAAKLSGGTNVTFDNVNIKGAGIQVDSGILKFTSGSVKDISSSTAGCAIKALGGDLYLGTEGLVTVSGNTCSAEENPCAVYIGGTASIAVKKAYIYNNKDSDNHPANLYLAKDEDSNQKLLTIIDTLTGSKIGIQTESLPAAGSFVTFTNAYGYNNSKNQNVTPGTYFIGDKDGVGFDAATGEAVLAKNGGSFNINFEEDITFALESMYVPYHTQKEMKIIVTKKKTEGTEIKETDVTADCTNFNYSLCYYGDDIGSDYYTNSTTHSFTIKDTLPSGTYRLFVSCKYNNVLYSQEIEVGVRTTDEFYVSENGDDGNNGRSASQPLKTFGRALKLFENSGSTNFLTIYVSGNVQLGTLNTERTNTLDATIPSLRIESPTGASINGGSSTILKVNSQSAITIRNVKFVNDESTYALNINNAKAKLTIQGKTALGRVYLKNGTFITADASLELPSGLENYAVVTPERTALGTKVCEGKSAKFGKIKLTCKDTFNNEEYLRFVNDEGKISLGYEFIPSWEKRLPDLSDDDIKGLINDGATAVNGVRVLNSCQLCNAHANVSYDQERWARMVGTTVVFRTNEWNYGVMTLEHVVRDKVGKKKMMRAYWRIRFIGQGEQDSRGMDSENSDIDVAFAGTNGRTNDIHTGNGRAINGATFYVLHYGNKWPDNVDNCWM